MLIQSHRHTSSDLQAWADYEAADLAEGERLLKFDLIDRATDELVRFAAAGECYAGFSGGKDSTVVAHLIYRAGLPIPIRHVRAVPVANPDTKAVRDALLACCPGLDYDDAEVVYPDLSPYEDCPEGDRLFRSTFRQWGSRHVSGVRASESSTRGMRMGRWGLSTAKTCAPIGWWSQASVFAYLAIHGLPVHPAYAMLGGGRWNRDQIRVDELAGSPGARSGRREWEREYYGDVLRRLGAWE